MTKEECLNEINTKYLRKDGKLNSALLRRDNFKKSPLNEFILERTFFLSPTSSYTERLHCIEKDLTSIPLCPFSNEPLWFSPNERCYSKCKKEFIQKVQNIPERMRKQRLSHVETIERKTQFLINAFLNNEYCKLNLSEVKRQTSELKLTSKSTQFIFLDDYINKKDLLCSVIHYTNSPLLPLDHDSGFHWAERVYLIDHDIFNPITCVDDPNKKAKFINSNKGYEKASCNLERVKHYFSNTVKPCIEQQGFDILNEEPISDLKSQRFLLRCAKCNTEFDADLRHSRWKRVYCFGCFKPVGRSKQEDEIVEFLKQNNIKNITLNNTSILATKEIDILLDDYNTAIELDGLLWHSFGNNYPNNASWEPKYKYKGAKKSIECFKRGIHLMHIYDNEWRDKKDIVKSLILANLTKCDRKIFARKCVIKDLTEEQQQIFFKHNSLFDYQKTFKSFGLFYKNELVSCMSFNINGDKIILTNFVSALNTTVTGGFSKLLSHIKRSYPSFCIEAKADFRLFSQKTLKLAGFVLKSLHKPKRFTTDGHHLYEEGETAPKKQRNFYDCGHGIFVLQPKKFNHFR